MYKTIDENEEQKKSNDLAGKIKFDDLGLKQTNDFAQFATETIKNEMPKQYESWKSKGSIGVIEAGKMFADEFDGSYDNVLTIEQQKQNYRDKHPVIGEERSNKVDERIAKNKRAREERQKRINEGSASLYDKIVNKLDQFGDNSYKAQVDAAKQNEQLQKPHEGNPNYRYEAKGADLSGRVIYNEVDLRKKIGFAEGLHDSIGSGEALPFVAGWVTGSYDKHIENIKNKVENGEQITQQELDSFNRYREREYEKQVRGYTVGGEIGASWMPSMLAFGSEMALGGAVLKGVGLADKGFAVGDVISKGLGSGKVAGATGKIAGHLIEGGMAAGVTSLVNPGRIYATYRERRLSDTMKITDRGTVIFTDAKESPAKAFLKSLQQVYISYFTENMGALIGMPVKGVMSAGAMQFAKVLEHNPMLKKLVQKTAPAFEKLNKNVLNSEPAQWLKSQVKFDGFLEELGEEVLEDVLNLTFKTNDEERSLENYIKAIFKSPEEWAVLAGTIALQDTTISLAGNLLADSMQRNGSSFEEIRQVLETSTEDEKASLIDELKENGRIKIDTDAIDMETSDSLKEQRKEKFVQNGMSQSKADLASTIENDMLNRLAQKANMDIEDVYAKEAPTIEQKDYEMSVDENGKRYKENEISQEDIDYYSDLADRYEFNQVENNKIMSENIEKNFGQSVEELQNNFTDDIKNILAENEIDYDEFEIEDVRLYGSYTTGKNKDTSDLDVIVQYKGKMKEDAAFNILNDENLTITDVNGVERKVDFNPINRELSGTIDEHIERMHEIDGAYYQTVSNVIKDDKKNLLMTHNAKSDNLDAILESGNLIAPSFAITKKDYEVDALSKFGDVTFIRKPEKIKFGSDNIYNRDIYSPRMPRPEYQLKDGTVIDSYEKDAQERLEKEKPERYKERFDKPTSERFKDAKKVMFTGYTPSGNRRYKPYTAENIIAQMKKEGLLSGENFDYGLSSLMSKFATKQKSMEELKESAKDGLYSSEQLNEDYENLKKEYEDLGDKIAPLYWDKWSFYEFQSDVFFAIAKNKKKYLKDTYNIEVPADLAKEVKDFVTKAQTMPRSYFEAKPMREVSLNEFGYALARVGTLTENQKDKLKNAYNINVIEYDNSIKEALEKVETEQPEIYFQSNYKNNGNIVDLTDDFETTPTSEDVKKYINELVESGKKFATLSPDWFVDVKGGAKKKAHIIKSSNFSKMNKVERKRHKKYIMSLEKLLANAEYSGEKENTKKAKKPNIAKYHYFTTNVRVGDKIYKVVFDTEEYKNEISSSSANVLRSVKNLDEDNNSITDNTENINPQTVHLYNITEYKPLNQEEQQSLFEGNNKARDIRKIKGSYMPAEKIIELFKNADESTIIHEYAHWYLSLMGRYAKVSAEIEEDLNEVRKFVKNSGEEFTKEQHEKFARGFEAYIRSGNARSNRLKKIYEDLKNALLQIYDEITKIVYTENGIDKPFTEEDLPQIKGLFDRLLSTENERIQRTVFDKVDEIDEQIKKIKENQAKEEQELDELYKGNIAAINRKSDKQRKVSEYLDLAEKATKRVPKAMRDFEKRYRDVTLAILSMASGKNRRWVADRRNWDKLYDILENVSDEIVANGADPAWSEFYALQGSTYDTEEIGADYKLAMQAYNNLVADDFSYSSYFKDPSVDQDIEDFYSQLNYLIDKIKTLKGEEKEIAFEAMFQLTNRMPKMPNDMMMEIVDLIEEVSEYKDEQQKEDFNRKSYPNIPVVQQLQMYVTRKLSELKVYNPDKRYASRIDKSHSLYKSIKNATSVNKTKKIIRKINDYVIEDLKNKQRRILHKEIQKQIKINSKLVKVGSVQQGKFDWRTNTIFSELKDLNKLSREDAFKKFSALVKANQAILGEERDNWNENIVESLDIDEDTAKLDDFQRLLKIKFLEYRSQRINNLDVLHTRSVLEDIMTLKFEGRRAKSEEDLKKKLNKYDYENNLIDILQKHKDNKIAKTLAKWIMHSQTLSNWESLLNGIFDAATAEKYSLQQMEVSTDIYAREHFLTFIKRASEIYGFKKASGFDTALDFDNVQPLADLFRKYDNELYDYKEITYNRETGKYVETQRQLSKAQILTIFTWSLNEELEQRLYTQFGLEQISDMFSHLTDEDMQLCFALIDCCNSMYDDTNEVFIRTLGISLPKVENYFPSKTERVGSDLDLFHDFLMKSSDPSFIKLRKTCNRIKMDPRSPLEILLPHINKTAKYVVMSENLNFYNKIFATADIKAKIMDVFGSKDGEKLHRVLLNQLAASTFSTYARGSAMTSDLLNTWFDTASNYITSAIGGSGKVTIGQLLSVINYAENMPAGEWLKGFEKAASHPVKTYKWMMQNCKYLQSRLAGNSQNEILQTLTSLQDPLRKLKNFWTLNVRWGDIIAITIGGKPYVDYLMSQGMTKEEAFNKFVDDTLRAQQAGLNSTTSEWQKNNAKNYLGRMFFAFRNTDIQYERKFIDAIIKYSRGDINKTQFVKTILIYKVLNPVLFTSFLQNMSLIYLFNGLLGFAGGGDDDKGKVAGHFLRDVVMALGVAGTNAYGIGGFALNALIQAIYAGVNNKIFNEDYKVFDSSVPILSDFEEIGKKIFSKKEVGIADVIDAFCMLTDLGTGVPTKKIKNSILGVGDIAKGEFGIGFSRFLGWGEYTSTMAWKGEAPKKKKKKRKLEY
jgi:predicted nucleotidyltransferase